MTIEDMTIEDRVRIDILGPLQVSHIPEIRATKIRQVLAMLAVNAGTVVTAEQLIDELWPLEPPRSVKTIVQTYIYQIRRIFSKGLGSPAGVNLVLTRPGGYVLTVPRDNIDLFRFLSLIETGRTALRQGRSAQASDVLHQALDLWRGPVLADIASGLSLRGISVFLEEQWLEAVALRIEADLANGRHRELVGELRLLVSQHNLHETFHLLLMRALSRSGRRAEALDAYSRLRHVLDDELGLEPSAEAKRIQREILEPRSTVSAGLTTA